MVPVLLPKTGHVLFQELEAAHPLGALPEVEVRHEQAGGPAVLRREPLPIVLQGDQVVRAVQVAERQVRRESLLREDRSEEHTSELQSQSNLVCRLLLAK